MNKYREIIIAMVLICISVSLSSCEKELSMAPEEKKSDDGYVYITSYPERMEIFLDGRRTGSFTPDSITWQQSGEKTITLKKNLFRDSILTVLFENGKKKILDIDFRTNQKMYGSVKCLSQPVGVQIFINDSSIGKRTPNVINNLWPGTYKIKYQQYGYWSSERSVTVKSNFTTVTEFALEDTSVWVTFNKSNSELQIDDLTTIAVDSRNRKWIGTTEYGIIVYNEKTYEIIDNSNSPLPDNVINEIFIDANDKVYIGTAGGFAMLEGSNWTIFTPDNSLLPNKYVTSFDISSSGRMMVGTKSGLVRYNEIDNTWAMLTSENYLFLPSDNLWISDIKFIDNRDYYIAMKGIGIAWYHDLHWSGYGYDFGSDDMSEGATPNLPDRSYLRNISEICIGNNSQVWFCHNSDQSSNLLFHQPPNTWSIAYKLGTNNINSIYVDENDYVWLATSKGVIKYKKNVTPTTIYSVLNSGLKNNYCTDIARDKNGILWITTLGGGLTKKKNMD